MKINEDFAAFHAYLSGDGHVSAKHKNYTIVSFINTDRTLLCDFKRRFRNLFGTSIKLHKSIKKHSKYKPCFVYYTGLSKIHEEVLRYGPYYSCDWRMPVELFSKKLKAIWLRAFFDCEGWVEVEKAKNRRIGLDCINLKGLNQIKNTLEKDFNIESSIKSLARGKIFRLQIFSKDNLSKFHKNIGFLHPKKRKALENAINSFMDYNWKFPENKILLEKFVRIIMLGAKIKRKRLRDVARVRINSIKKSNLIQLSERLFEFYGVESRIFGPLHNNCGSTYYEFSIHKKESISKLAKNKLLPNRKLKMLN